MVSVFQTYCNETKYKYKLETMISDLNEPEFVVPEGSSFGHSLKDHYDQVNLTFSDVAHIVVEVYQKGLKKLEEIAIKTILKDRTPTGQLPEENGAWNVCCERQHSREHY